MKKLNLFVRFDAEKFLKGKKLMYVGSKNDQKGIKSALIILEDRTIIEGYTNGLNEFEKIYVRSPDSAKSCIQSLKRKDIVEIYDIENAVIWGDFRENLTIYGKIRKIN